MKRNRILDMLQAADDLLVKYSHGEVPVNIEEIARNVGVDVEKAPPKTLLENLTLQGRRIGKTFLLEHSTQAIQMYRYNLAYEVGIKLLGEDRNPTTLNIFAAALLIPESFLIRYHDTKQWDMEKLSLVAQVDQTLMFQRVLRRAKKTEQSLFKAKTLTRIWYEKESGKIHF